MAALPVIAHGRLRAWHTRLRWLSRRLLGRRSDRALCRAITWYPRAAEGTVEDSPPGLGHATGCLADWLVLQGASCVGPPPLGPGVSGLAARLRAAPGTSDAWVLVTGYIADHDACLAWLLVSRPALDAWVVARARARVRRSWRSRGDAQAQWEADWYAPLRPALLRRPESLVPWSEVERLVEGRLSVRAAEELLATRTLEPADWPTAFQWLADHRPGPGPRGFAARHHERVLEMVEHSIHTCRPHPLRLRRRWAHLALGVAASDDPLAAFALHGVDDRLWLVEMCGPSFVPGVQRTHLVDGLSSAERSVRQRTLAALARLSQGTAT